MSCYLRLIPGNRPQVWRIDAHEAVLLGVTNPEGGAGTYFRANPGESIWDAIKRSTPWFEPDGQNPFLKTTLQQGEFYPRMARPYDHRLDDSPGWNPWASSETAFIAIARSQLMVLTQQLERICQTVQPVEATFATFGHDIRNLLILACTEVESHWRGVLKANGTVKDRYTTVDYLSLRLAFKLDEFAIEFPKYPWLAPLAPFAGWGSTGKPTQDLKWYDAYNAVKHDRETEFERATLRHAFEAVSACVIMIAAQFGMPGLGHETQTTAFFHLSHLPAWPPSESYILPREEGVEWTAVHYKF